MSANILIIDPDHEALLSYESALASKSSSWVLATAQTDQEAFACVEEATPDIVLAPMRMNNGQGLALLSSIIDRAPLAHAFIVAQESEKESLANALANGCRFLPAGCDADRLLLELKRCLAIDSWFENPVIKEIFAERKDLECLPENYLKIVNAINSPKSSVGSISEIVRADLAIASKILETVNSSFYGFDEKVSDVHQAISVLGLSVLKNIVLAVQVFERVGSTSTNQALVKEIWHHSVSVAVAAKRIALYETKDPQTAEEAYSAGLLHDIGKLIILSVAPEQFIEAQRYAREKGIPAWQAEQKELGCDHGEVGAYLLARWGLPEPLCEAAALHHRPANACASSFTALAAVHSANAIVRKKRNAEHLDAKPAKEFLDEIALADKWTDWEAVATGARPKTKRKPGLSLQPKPSESTPTENSEPKESSADLTTTAAHLALSRSAEEVAARQERELHINRFASGGRNTFLAFAAGIVFSLCCIYFLSTIGDAPAKPIPSPSKKPVESTINSRKDVMNELLNLDEVPTKNDSQDSAIQIEEEIKIEEPPPPPPPPFPEIALGAIFQRSTGAKAQVNGKILGIGDSIDEARITSIDTISITVEHYGREKVFTLK